MHDKHHHPAPEGSGIERELHDPISDKLIPLAPLDLWLREPARLNPIVLALVDAGLAAAAALYHVALLLLGLVAYRRLASSGI